MHCCDSCGLNAVFPKEVEFLTPDLPRPPGWGLVWNEGLQRLLSLDEVTRVGPAPICVCPHEKGVLDTDVPTGRTLSEDPPCFGFWTAEC